MMMSGLARPFEWSKVPRFLSGSDRKAMSATACYSRQLRLVVLSGHFPGLEVTFSQSFNTCVLMYSQNRYCLYQSVQAGPIQSGDMYTFRVGVEGLAIS